MIEENIGYKKCKVCEQIKNVSEFYTVNTKGHMTYRGPCKKCYNLIDTAHKHKRVEARKRKASTCIICNKEKPLSDFYKNDLSHCRECNSKSSHERQKENQNIIANAKKDEIDTTIECIYCNIKKPSSDFYRPNARICKICKNALKNCSPEESKKIRNLKVNSQEILESMYNTQDQETDSEKQFKGLKDFFKLINDFNLGINKYLYMESLFKNYIYDESVLGLLKKSMGNLETIIKYTEGTNE